MIVADSSVAIAAFAAWHVHHDAAQRAVSTRVGLVAHAALETYSVLTRMPAPHRAPADTVQRFLAARFPGPYLTLGPEDHRASVARLARLGITGGAAYDGIIALTAAGAGATLLSCATRARTTYERCGVAVELIG